MSNHILMSVNNANAVDRAFRRKRAEQSKLCRARKRAQELGISVDEYLDSIVPMSYDERKARRNEQSKACRLRKKNASEFAERVNETVEFADAAAQTIQPKIAQTVEA